MCVFPVDDPEEPRRSGFGRNSRRSFPLYVPLTASLRDPGMKMFEFSPRSHLWSITAPLRSKQFVNFSVAFTRNSHFTRQFYVCESLILFFSFFIC